MKTRGGHRSVLSPHLRASHRTCHRLWLTLEPVLTKRSVTVCRRVMDESARGVPSSAGSNGGVGETTSHLHHWHSVTVQDVQAAE
jgi:hypothetical protein